MRTALLYGPRDVRLVERVEPRLRCSSDVLVKVIAAGICGSDLRPYRGQVELPPASPLGHEVMGLVVQTGRDVEEVKVGDSVIVPFNHADGTCAACSRGNTQACQNGSFTVGGQGDLVRVRHADASLVVVPAEYEHALIPSLLTLSDVMPTGWHAAVSAQVAEGSTVAIIGDGAVGLCAAMACIHMGADSVIVMTRHVQRAIVATSIGAQVTSNTDGSQAVSEIMALTDGQGPDAVLDCVGSTESLRTATEISRPGGKVSLAGVPHETTLDLPSLFAKNLILTGGLTPVRRYLPELLNLIVSGALDPGVVFDLHLPLSAAAQGYARMDERSAIKVLLHP